MLGANDPGTAIPLDLAIIFKADTKGTLAINHNHIKTPEYLVCIILHFLPQLQEQVLPRLA